MATVNFASLAPARPASASSSFAGRRMPRPVPSAPRASARFSVRAASTESVVPGVGLMMTRKPTCVGPSDSVDTVAKILCAKNFAHLPVIDDAGVCIGVVSETDLLFSKGLMSKYAEDNAKVGANFVEEAMTAEPITATEKTKFDEAAHIMLSKRIHCLPVVDAGGVCVGIVTRKDIIRYGFRHLLQQ